MLKFLLICDWAIHGDPDYSAVEAILETDEGKSLSLQKSNLLSFPFCKHAPARKPFCAVTSFSEFQANSFWGDFGYGMTFTLGRGNEIIAKAVESLNPLVIGWDIREVKADKLDGHYSTSLRWCAQIQPLIDAFRSSRISGFTGRKSSAKVKLIGLREKYRPLICWEDPINPPDSTAHRLWEFSRPIIWESF